MQFVAFEIRSPSPNSPTPEPGVGEKWGCPKLREKFGLAKSYLHVTKWGVSLTNEHPVVIRVATEISTATHAGSVNGSTGETREVNHEALLRLACRRTFLSEGIVFCTDRLQPVCCDAFLIDPRVEPHAAEVGFEKHFACWRHTDRFLNRWIN